MRSIFIAVVVLLTGCASTQHMVQPPGAALTENKMKDVARSKDAVWNDAVAQLGQRFFVINNLDKSSGLINISYGGDPEKYVDCGTVTVTTKGPGGGTKSFSGSAPDVTYMTAVPIPPYNLPANIQVRRQMALEGRVNLIFEVVDANRTRVTAATRYIVTRKMAPVGPAMFQSSSDTVSFNANETGRFSPAADGRSLTCVSTGMLESSLLDVIN